MLYLIGLGLGDAKDITVKGLEIVKQCSRVYLEAYTSILTVGKEALGDHTQRSCSPCSEAGNSIQSYTQCLHNECCRLLWFTAVQLRRNRFHRFLDRYMEAREFFRQNRQKQEKRDAHTLLTWGKKIYEPPRYMTVNEAAEQLLAVVQNRRVKAEESEVSGNITEDTVCVGLARVGAADQKIAAGTLLEMTTAELGGPLHSMIITGTLHPLEIDMLKLFAVNTSIFEH
ncbi:diphthine methyl ester synthase isoform X2 [Hemicordylus capensis]|uniref:diphthine methyl ester synthase isoform X2 n=1 Tax=Hemicordylus capensis TaxID=884348 RepID=UPI002303BE16|nr:diphthine methyl ester synthase isoform X2 [Hemicordylus capensis]